MIFTLEDDINIQRLKTAIKQGIIYTNLPYSYPYLDDKIQLFRRLFINISPVLCQTDALLNVLIFNSRIYFLYNHDYIDLHSILYIFNIISDYYYYGCTKYIKPLLSRSIQHHNFSSKTIINCLSNIFKSKHTFNLKPSKNKVSGGIYDIMDSLTEHYGGLYVVINDRKNKNIPEHMFGNYTIIVLLLKGEDSRKLIRDKKAEKEFTLPYPILNNRFNYKLPPIIKEINDVAGMLYFQPGDKYLYKCIS